MDILNEVKRMLSEEIQKNNETRLKRLKNIESLTLCVGCGISCDVNKSINKNDYQWNGLVYGIAGELLKSILSDTTYVNNLQTKNNLSQDIVKKYREYISKYLEALVENKQFLESDNTMECVEYLKYLAFPHEKGTPEEDYSETVIALITHYLFNNKRFANGEDSVFGEIKKEYAVSYPPPTLRYSNGNGKTLVEVAQLLNRMKNADVLSYNYDDYLETALDVLGYDKTKIHSYYNNSSIDGREEGINIFHVHGFTPKEWTGDRKNGDFIFSENSYSHMSDEIYRWTNRVQAELFSSRDILFVGFSGVDTNFRRLMKEINKERHRIESDSGLSINNHTMFMGYRSIIEKACQKQLFNERLPKGISSGLISQVVSQLVFEIVNAKDQYYKEQLGIDLLWYYNYSEIADMLHTIHNKSEESSSE